MSIQVHKPRLPYDVLFLVIQFTDDKSTLYRVAQTCRALSEPALNELWHTMDTVVPLLFLAPLRTISGHRLTGAGSYIPVLRVDNCSLHTRRTIIDRILSNSKRIKILRGLNSKAFYVDYQALQFLKGIPCTHILPNLTELILIKNEPTYSDHSSFILELLGPRLKTIVLTLHCMGIHDHIDEIVMTALQNCSKLEHLELLCTGAFCEDHPLMQLRLETCLSRSSIHQDCERVLTAASSASIKTVRIIPGEPRDFCDILVTPLTSVILGCFKSISYLDISANTTYPLGDHPLVEGPSSAFPSLRYLRLRLHGAVPLTWFFNALHAENLMRVYLHFVQDISTSELDTFISSLDQFKDKFSKLQSLSFRASIYPSNEPYQLIPSMVAAAARLSPSLTFLKLKLFPFNDPTGGFVRGDDLPDIAGTFPNLRSLKVAGHADCVQLTDVIALAQRFPRLHEIGMNFQCSKIDFLPKDEPLESSPSESGLRILKVRDSEVRDPTEVAAYLRKSLPQLQEVRRCRNSRYRQWDMVHKLLSDCR